MAWGSHTLRKKVKPQTKCRKKIFFRKFTFPRMREGGNRTGNALFLGLHDRPLMQVIDAPTLTEAKNGCLFSEALQR